MQNQFRIQGRRAQDASQDSHPETGQSIWRACSDFPESKVNSVVHTLGHLPGLLIADIDVYSSDQHEGRNYRDQDQEHVGELGVVLRNSRRHVVLLSHRL